MIEAKMVADSIGEYGDRISSMVVTFPRIILAELNTHRMFSRNSASSRAIPFNKMVKSVQENPFIPIAWQRDHKGMQGTEYITTENGIYVCETGWLGARDKAIEHAEWLNSCNITKQLCNRLLEPFMWHTVLITATEFENFFALRCPQYNLIDNGISYSIRSKKDYLKKVVELGGTPDTTDLLVPDRLAKNQDYWLQINKGQAEIHMMALAEAMWDCMNESTPKELKAGEWHIPFGDRFDIDETTKIIDQSKDSLEMIPIKIATARCARVSYTLVGDEEKEANYENDIKLHDRLAKSGHWSPFEHCAKAMSSKEYDSWHRGNSKQTGGLGWCGNFRGFIQYRKLFENENIIK